jgi:hypothetical protein
MCCLSTEARQFVRNSFGLCIPPSSGYLFVTESLLKQKKREASKTGETSTVRIAYSQGKRGKKLQTPCGSKHFPGFSPPQLPNPASPSSVNNGKRKTPMR